jgi:pimeloyl-ACP methyl ester carboxylesterase
VERVRRMVHAGPGVDIEVIVEGAGSPIVLAPSFGRGSADFDAVADGLRRAGLRVLRPQPRGTGRSTGPMTGLTYADWAGDLLAALAEDGGGPAVLVGHAAGSRYVRAAAALAPGMVSGVVLAGAARPGPPDPELVRDLDRCVDASTSTGDRRAALRRSFFAPAGDVDGWLTGWSPATARAQRATAPGEGWSDAGGVPVLDLIGRHDPWRPESSHDDLAAAFGPRATVTVVDGASHALLPERPAEVVAAITEWVARRSSALRPPW